MLIASDGGCDESHGRVTKIVVRQVDHLDWLHTPQLINGDCVTVDSAESAHSVTQGSNIKAKPWEAQKAHLSDFS